MSRNLFRGSILTCLLGQLNAEINSLLEFAQFELILLKLMAVKHLRVGKFLYENKGIDCGKYTIDPLPHDESYFHSQLVSVHSLF